MTADALVLSDRLRTRDVQQRALERTGLFWRPIPNRLKARDRTLVPVNSP